MPDLQFLLREFVPADTDAVIALWEECGLVRPWNDPRRDIARKLTVQPELFLVLTDESGSEAGTGTVVAAGMAGYDGHRGWVNYLAVTPSRRGAGLGRLLMAEFEQRLAAMGCPKLNLQVRAGNDAVMGFYAALGYVDDRTVSMGKRLIADDDASDRPLPPMR